MLRRFLQSRLAGVRHLAADFADGLDDRSKLFSLELAAERQRLTRLVIAAVGAFLASMVAIVWAAATLVAFTWDTEWRHVVLLSLLAFWVALALGLCIKALGLLQAGGQAFRFSRQVAADDLDRVRESMR